jgi:pilus assembly protein Flp/PilA
MGLLYIDAALDRGCCNHPGGIPEMALINDLYLKVLTAFDRDEEGQGLAEYALILALIAIVAIIALIFLGSQVSKILSTVGNSV